MYLRLPEQLAVRTLSYKLMRLATKDFDEGLVVGKGASGKVYKGCLEKGVIGDKETTVAIKRLHQGYRYRDFKEEVKMLSALRHCNIQPLLGYCDEHVSNEKSRELILVFDFMKGGNLGQRLYSKPSASSLSWVQRLKICIGIGQGLNYLHSGLYPYGRIIHGDVKSFNILLDENLVPKVSDFGSSKLIPPAQSYYILNPQTIPTEFPDVVKYRPDQVDEEYIGSPGYLEPTLLLRMTDVKVTSKFDVYSFGVVLLETLCGRHARNTTRPLGKHRLTNWARPALKNYVENSSSTGGDDYEQASKLIREIMDSNVVKEINRSCLTVFVKLVNQCLEEVPEKRPTMVQVVATLERALAYQVQDKECALAYQVQDKEYENCHPVHPCIVDEYDFRWGGHVCYDTSFSHKHDTSTTDDQGSILGDSGTAITCNDHEDDTINIAVKA